MSAPMCRKRFRQMFVFFVLGGVFLLAFEPPAHAQKKHPAEEKARSLKSDFATSIDFVNQSQSDVKVFWLNMEGNRELKQVLKPGDQTTQKTFLNHAWVLTDDKDNALGLYYPDADKRVVTYGEAKANPFAAFGKKGVGGFGKGGFPGGGGAPGGGGFGGKGGFGGFGTKVSKAIATPKLAYVQDAAALAELKLTAEQTARVKTIEAKHKKDVDDLAQQGLTALQRSRKTAELTDEADRNVANLLEPAQNKRLEQMQRQDLGSKLFTDRTLVEAVQITPEQRVKLLEVATRFATEIQEARKADPTGNAEFVKKLAQSRKTAFDAATALLAAEQKTIWNDLVGAPWPDYIRTSGVAVESEGPRGFSLGSALRSRPYDFNNWIASNNRFLTEKSVQDALKMTNEQIAKIGGKGASAANVLTPAQLKQYQGIYLQQSMTAYGPAGTFRYREVLDLLNLSDAQKTKILAIGQSDAKEYSTLKSGRAEISAEGLKKLDKSTSDQLDNVLTADQRNNLKALIGEPFKGVIQNPFGVAANPWTDATFAGKGGREPAKGKKKKGAPLP